MKRVICILTVFALLVTGALAVTATGGNGPWGDVNGDNEVNMKDVLSLRKSLAGIETLSNNAAGDLNSDGVVNMKDVLMLRKFMAGLIEAPVTTTTAKPTKKTTKKTTATTVIAPTETIAEPTETGAEPTETAVEPTETGAEPTATGLQPDPSGAYYYDENHDPVIGFLDGVDDCSLGVWWWNTEDGNNEELREFYLDFLEKNRVTEIYYYCLYDMVTSGGRATTHEFVVAAAAHDIKVIPLYDDVGMINGVEQADVRVTQMIDMFDKYHDSYPDDVMDMIHFDVEPHLVFQDKNIKHLTERELDLYAKNFIGGVQSLRENGIKVEAALNCTWNNYGGENIEFNGVTGIYNIIAANIDSMCMMAYRDTAEDILELGTPGFEAAMKYGTRITYGIETGHYSFNKVEEEFAQETKEYMYTEFCKVFESLRNNHPTGGYGLAVHQHRTWTEMNNDADVA